MQSNLIYGVKDRPNTVKEWLGYSLQVVCSCITATLLIALICGVDLSAGLVSAGISTLFFLCITKFKASIVISNSGATVSAVVGAIALTNSVQKDFTAVVIGGLVVAAVYCVAAGLIKRFGVDWITDLITPVMSGAIILIIAVQLGFFIPTYAQINGNYSLVGTIIALTTMGFVLFFAVKGRGITKNLPILFGVGCGYLLCVVLSLFGVKGLVDLEQFQHIKLISVPDFAFLHINFKTFDVRNLPQIILSFGLVSLGALAEHLGDIINASNISEADYLHEPGLHRTLVGDGVGSLIGCCVGAMCNTTYTEHLSTILISKCASVYVAALAAIELILLGFIGVFNTIITQLPNCVFAGASICCYGMIAVSAIRMLKQSNVKFNDTKTIWIFAVMLMVGTSGFSIKTGVFDISGVCFAIIVGIILNLVLKEDKHDKRQA